LSLAAVELSDQTFLFYVNSDGNIGYLTGPAASVVINQETTYTPMPQVLIDGQSIHVVDEFPQLGAVGYNTASVS
jgi:hypothetical protein